MQTYIKNEMNVNDVVKMFQDYGRGDNFSAEGIEALLNMLEDCYSDDGAIDLDIIGLCCDYTESTPSQLFSDYSHCMDCDEDTAADECLLTDYVLNEMQARTFAVLTDAGTILYQNF